MNSITLGSPNLFVKGMVDVIVTDPSTGNIVGYDNVSSESAVNTSVNMGEITGGLGNALLMNIPDTTRISGTLTSQAFSLQQRALATGGQVNYGGVISYCETVTAGTGGILTTTKAAAKSYAQGSADTTAWAYVRAHGASTFDGAACSIPVGGNTVSGYVGAVAGQQYDIFYFVNSSTCQVLPLSSNFDPSVVSLTIKYAVYAKVNDKVSNGTLQGYLYLVVPRAQFTGDAGTSANQTSNSTTSYDWTAVLPERTMMECTACGTDTSNYAYYIYAPCEVTSGIKRIAFVGVGSDLSYPAGTTFSIPTVFVMENGSIVTADYSLIEPTAVSGTSVEGVFFIRNSAGEFTGNMITNLPSSEEGPYPTTVTFTVTGTNISTSITVDTTAAN